MTAIGGRLRESIDSLGLVSSACGAATTLARIQVAMKAIVTQLAAIVPSERRQVGQERLVKAVGVFASELTPLIARLKAGQVEAFALVVSLEGLQGIGAATAAITEAGYSIRPTRRARSEVESRA